ncbi:MAG: bifunctional glutamate N-acetyltransferase/amino-acid acetyltransferase ArgJ [Planctomycetota bacterium]
MPSSSLPAGFRFAGSSCGIKPSGSPDLSLVVADRPLTAVGVYTKNQIVAAPVVLCRQRTPSQTIRAVVTNSGNANACTGEQGVQDAASMCRLVGEQLGINESDVLVMSTGVIGQTLPMDRVASGIEQAARELGDGQEHFQVAADAILTTDKQRKIAAESVPLGDAVIRVASMAKGAGMIAPNMATMLGMIFTDAAIEPELAQSILRSVADSSFNRVSVDGHTSTNDTLLLLASGTSDVTIDDSNRSAFEAAVRNQCIQLAVEMVADGEGASRVMKIAIGGAQSDEDAETIARIVGESPLVKTAITGCDPNWGRIVSAAGNAAAPIDPSKTTLALCGTMIYRDGAPTDYDEPQLSRTMAENQVVEVELTVGAGNGTSTHWASDLTTNYVRFNSEYTT